MSKNYVIVTTITHFRHRFAIPIDAIKQEYPHISEENFDPISLAEELVSSNSVEELSQVHISEDIIGSYIVDEQQALVEFDIDNAYLKDVTEERKLRMLNNWKVSW